MAEQFLGEVRPVSFNVVPRGWALCDGQSLPINQNPALFALLGTRYGGNGTTNFFLPDLRGRAPIHFGNGFTQGERGGEVAHTLTAAEMPAHTHPLNANRTTAATVNTGAPAAGGSLGQTIGTPSSGAAFSVSIYSDAASPVAAQAPANVGNFGGSQPHENRQPFTVVSYIIALQGFFPSRG